MGKKSDKEEQRESMIKRVLGCWHMHISRPITTNSDTYQYCLNCGKRRRYDMEKFKAVGSFYSPPTDIGEHFV